MQDDVTDMIGEHVVVEVEVEVEEQKNSGRHDRGAGGLGGHST